jgi:hypothetical protein
MLSNVAGSRSQPSRQLMARPLNSTCFSFITPIDPNQLVGASVLKSRWGTHYAPSAKRIRYRRTLPIMSWTSDSRVPLFCVDFKRWFGT